ncbi:hypothetical protein HUO13_07165 [Saccharopolyspora erythraea]|uniref:hypothetical protein n=1 Tax=Saccharopolyspora erythraea TaxID=1836 RepID=UPI001BA6DF52|nr:hypothetical protein [Saccharopolyspora erythraea]QUH00627.1 hypothetical protein HUO13_07165 [Saccharopolyspora erythraea]
MEIVAEGVEVTGAHGPLLQRTSLRVHGGQLLLVAGDSEIARTALALTVAGRLAPTAGTVRLDGAITPSGLREAVAVVDAPDVTEPEPTVSVRTVVAEGLSFAGLGSRRSRVRTWLAAHDADQHERERFENLPALVRTRLLVDLSRAAGPRALVLDSPDRHGGDPAGWYSLARRQAERGIAVVVACSTHSALRLQAPHALIGEDNRPEDTTVDLTPAHSEGSPR